MDLYATHIIGTYFASEQVDTYKGLQTLLSLLQSIVEIFPKIIFGFWVWVLASPQNERRDPAGARAGSSHIRAWKIPTFVILPITVELTTFNNFPLENF